MKTAGVIIKDIYDDTSRISKLNIEDTSDHDWSPAMKKSWPYFIMGVSQMWLNLIEVAEDISDGNSASSLENTQDFYKRVNESIRELWQEEGGRALLHHLNAIFGYEHVIIYEKRLMTF